MAMKTEPHKNAPHTLDFTSRILNRVYTIRFFVFVVHSTFQKHFNSSIFCECVCVSVFVCSAVLFQHTFHSLIAFFHHSFFTPSAHHDTKNAALNHSKSPVKYREKKTLSDTYIVSSRAGFCYSEMLSIMRQKYSVGETGILDRQLNKY